MGAGHPGASTIPGTSADTGGWSQYFAMRDLVLNENACALPGVPVRYETFLPHMWRAVALGCVRHEDACYVAAGLRWGFDLGVRVSELVGHRWFKNYPSAVEAREAVTKGILKRVDMGRTLDLGEWGPALASTVRGTFANSFIFPMGAVPKGPLQPDEMRATSDHSRTGLNAATVLDFLRHSLDTYNEVAWFLQQDYFMRVSDVDGAFTILPIHYALWPFFMFRFWAGKSDRQRLYMHTCGDFGAAGMPGVFKKFFVDVVVGAITVSEINPPTL